jgi:predicted DNA-binding ribbon-helix-helix protein
MLGAMKSRSSFRPRNLYRNGWKTSVRLEPEFWDALADVARETGLSWANWHSRSTPSGDWINRYHRQYGSSS